MITILEIEKVRLNMEIIDEQILQTLKSSSPEESEMAFETIYSVYFRKILKFFYVKIGRKEFAEEASNEVFIKLWEYRYELDFENKYKLQKWLYTVAKQELIDYIREKYKKIHVTYKDVEKIHQPVYQETEKREAESGDINDIYEVVEKCLREEKQENKALWEARYIHKKSYQEIAKDMAIIEATARVKMYRINKRLRQKVKEEIERRK